MHVCPDSFVIHLTLSSTALEPLQSSPASQTEHTDTRNRAGGTRETGGGREIKRNQKAKKSELEKRARKEKWKEREGQGNGERGGFPVRHRAHLSINYHHPHPP